MAYSAPISFLTVSAPYIAGCSEADWLTWKNKSPNDIAARWFDMTAFCAAGNLTVASCEAFVVYTDGLLFIQETDLSENILKILLANGSSGYTYSIRITATMSDGQVLNWYVAMECDCVPSIYPIPAVLADPIQLQAFMATLPTEPAAPFWNNVGVLTRTYDAITNDLSSTQLALMMFMDSLPTTPTYPYYMTGGQLVMLNVDQSQVSFVTVAQLQAFVDSLPTVPADPFWNNAGMVTEGN